MRKHAPICGGLYDEEAHFPVDTGKQETTAVHEIDFEEQSALEVHCRLCDKVTFQEN